MSAAIARAEARPAQTANARSDASGRAFARVEVCRDFAQASAAWNEIAAKAPSSPYQSMAFARAWVETVGAARGISPLIAIARDASGDVVALLPLGLRRRGLWRIAAFLGDRHANFQMGLFAGNAHWSRGDVQALLDEVARQAGADAFTFISQPESWKSARNPLAELPMQPSPSFAFASALPDAFETWMDRHFSKSSKKKLRKKAAKLQTLGDVAHRRAADLAEARAILDAFLAQKHARMRALGEFNEFDEAATIALFERMTGLTGADSPILELHALRVGERIIATFGGLSDGERLSGLFVSFDTAPETAASSPGEQLITEVIRDAIARGLTRFDLGVGEARYKSECCEAIEPLFDSAFAPTVWGRIGATLFLAARRLKRAIKQSPRLYALALRVRRRLR